MVIRLEGRLDGQDIVFQRIDGDRWECICPLSNQSEIVLELRAYDDAGNFCYKTCFLIIFDPTSLEIQLVPMDYWIQLVLDDVYICCTDPVEIWLEPLL